MNFFIQIIIILITWYITVLVHEFGHFFFGKITGYKFVSFKIFNFEIVKINNKLKLMKTVSFPEGQCLLSPPQDFYKTNFTLYNLGGSLFNFIYAIITLILLFFVKNEILFDFLFINFLVNLSVGILNIFPINSKSIVNDGYNLLLCKKSEQNRKAFYNILKVNALEKQEFYLKDMPEEIFHIGEEDKIENTLSLGNGINKLNYIYDLTKDLDLYEKNILEILNKNTCEYGLFKYYLIGELLFLKIIKNSKKEEIEEIVTEDNLKMLKKYSSIFPSISRDLYTYELLFNKNEKDIGIYLKKYHKIIKTIVSKSDKKREEEFFYLINKENL